MQRTARPRHYVSRGVLFVLRPFLRYSYSRDAYVLQIIGERWGPVLREDLRRRQLDYAGNDRRDRVLDAGASSLSRAA
jgi:hypothetical protein